MIEVFGPWLVERNLLFASNHFFWVTTSRPTFFVCLPNLVTFLKQKISLQERGERGTRDRDRTPGTSWAEHPRVTNPSLRHRCHKDRKYIGSVQLRRKKRERLRRLNTKQFSSFFLLSSVFEVSSEEGSVPGWKLNKTGSKLASEHSKKNQWKR